MVAVVDGSESLTRALKTAGPWVDNALRTLSAKTGREGTVAALRFSDELLPPLEGLECDAVQELLEDHWVFRWKTPTDKALLEAGWAQRLARRAVTAGHGSRIAREGMALKPALEMALAAARCGAEGKVPQIVILADAGDIGAIGPEDNRPDRTPGEVLETWMSTRFRAGGPTLTVIGLPGGADPNRSRPLQISWPMLEGMVHRMGGTAVLATRGDMPVIGEKRRPLPLMWSGDVVLEPALRPPLIDAGLQARLLAKLVPGTTSTSGPCSHTEHSTSLSPTACTKQAAAAFMIRFSESCYESYWMNQYRSVVQLR